MAFSVAVALIVLFALPAGSRAAVDVAVSAEDGTVYVDARFMGVFDEELDASLTVTSSPGAGTVVELSVRIPGIAEHESEEGHHG